MMSKVARTRKLRILHISSHFYPHVDGTVRSIDTLIRGLQQRHHNVYLITRQMPNTPHIENYSGITVIRIPSSGRSLLHRLLLGISQTFAGSSLIKRERVDIIDTHGFSSMITGFLLKKIYHVPLILTFHGFPRLWMRGLGWRKWYENFFSYPVEKFLIMQAEKIIVRSPMFAKMVTSTYGSNISRKIEVIPHAVNTELFSYERQKTEDAATILFVGGLTRVYGAELLIRATPIVLKYLPRTHVIIVGKGPLRDQLEKLTEELHVEKSVVFTGLLVDQKKLVQYYHLSNVVVIPLKYKGYILSVAAVEALATGRPIITTMHLDPKLKDVGVFLVKESTPDELAKTMVSVLSDKKRLETMSVAARKYTEEFHSMDKYLSRMETIYTQSVGNVY